MISKVVRRVSEDAAREAATEAAKEASKEAAKEVAKEAIREAVKSSSKGADKSEVVNGIELAIKGDDEDPHKASPATDTDRVAEEFKALKEFVASILAEATANATANQLPEGRNLNLDSLTLVLLVGLGGAVTVHVGGYFLHRRRRRRRGRAAAEAVVSFSF